MRPPRFRTACRVAVLRLKDSEARLLQGKLVGTVDKTKVPKDEVLAMIIMGKHPGEASNHELAEFHD